MRNLSLSLLLAVLFLAACTSGNATTLLQPGDLIFRGTVSALNGDSVTMNNKVFDLRPSTEFFLNNNTEGTRSDLNVGDYALFAARQNDNGTLSITKLQILDDTSEDLEAAGVVTAVGPSSVTINGIQWNVNSSTEFAGSLSSLSSLQVGQVVQVEGPQGANGFTAAEITSDVESTDVGHAGELEEGE